MSETLVALYSAVIDNPDDRTVRLVYADALDESGEPSQAAHAEFIRTQIERECLPESDDRHEVLTARQQELFQDHWLTWWQNICEAAGFPAPHSPGLWSRLRLLSSRRSLPRNWPYRASESSTAIIAEDYLFTVDYAGGLPEAIQFNSLRTPEHAPELLHRWGDAIPLRRLILTPNLTAEDWQQLDGPHLARLPELSIQRFSMAIAPLVTASPNLRALSRLTIHPAEQEAELIRSVVASPTWRGLRVLNIDGALVPETTQTLASCCTLEHLEELHVMLTNPFWMMTGIVHDLFRMMLGSGDSRPSMVSRSEIGAGLELLARAGWIKRLSRLTLNAVPRGLESIFKTFGLENNRLANVLPDRSILALAESLNTDKLERLVLQEAAISPAAREELTSLFRDRVVFT